MRKTRKGEGPTPLRSRGNREFGYGRPPRGHQFKPGQSGNPKGRPKGAKNESTILRDLLNRKIEVRQSGKLRKVSVLEAMLLKFAEDALKGNPKSAAFLLNRYGPMEPSEAQPNGISEDDQEILDAFARKLEIQFKNRKESP